MAAPPLVFNFLGIVFTAILYGKLSDNIQKTGGRRTLCHRCLLHDI